ncbi:non-homologous end joining protein Ku [Catenuloplanes japonicus]|uniref:non-homologous end joining protein Ku n=1 Tax=Catenuloplanes japonicus TaxID=33876 RepID=UPI0005270CDC|nr:Ku protein [Catenuloplanes japonicus]
MRAIWKGAVSFGLVSIAVRLFSATEEKDIRFHQVHRDDGGRIKYKRVCSVDGEEVQFDDIAKGYDIGGGEMVILTDDDFADLPLSTSRAIEVLEFVPADQVDAILYNKSYYLEPDGTATKPYVLLREALGDADRVAIVKVALRQREQLATLRVHDDVLLLNTMLWPDEVRKPGFGFLDDDIEVRPAELAMASSLIDSMAADFDPKAYSDNYRAALQEVINAKVEGREVVAPEEEEEAAPAATDLMAALRASVERARAARGEEPPHKSGDGTKESPDATTHAPGSAKKAAAGKTDDAPAKRAPAKKAAAPAKKAAATTTAKKTTAAKSTAAAKKATGTKSTAAAKSTAKKAS